MTLYAALCAADRIGHPRRGPPRQDVLGCGATAEAATEDAKRQYAERHGLPATKWVYCFGTFGHKEE